MAFSRSRKGTKAPSYQRATPLWKKLAFALATTLVFFLGLEGVLALLGFHPVLATRDPFVGFASNIPLYVETRRADGRVVMRTAENKLAYFNAQQFLKSKPAGTYRIFCMGGSTTYGQPYDDTTSFAGWLRELLPVADPSRKWEVVNAGGISYASYRVAALMEEFAQYQPDLFVVYTGHNEFLEERTYGEIKLAHPARLRLAALLGRTRTGALLDRWVNVGQRPGEPRFQLPREVDARLDHTVGPSDYHRDDALRLRILDHYRFNLARMVAIARGAGAEILLINPASNLKDCSPFKSQHRDGLSEEDRQRWSSLLDRGTMLAEQGNANDALALYQRAADIDRRFAELQYRIGHLLFEMRRLAEARGAFERARDEDVCPLRGRTEISTIIADTADRLGAWLVDFESLLKNESLRGYGHNCPGREYFLDHVHPTVDANGLLAVAIVERLMERGVVENRGSWNDDGIAQAGERIESRIDTAAHAGALRNLAKVLNWAGKHSEAGPLALKALETLPQDPESLVLAAAYLKTTGRVDEAVAYYRETLDVAPDDAEAHRLLGAAMVERGQLEEARRHFCEVIRVQPGDAHAHHMVGSILAEQEQFDKALAYYHEANRLKPDDAHVHYNIAFALDNLGKRAEAVQWYERTIRLNPDDAEAHNRLGVLLAARGRLDEAIEHYRRALRIQADYEEARANLLQAEKARTSK